MTDTIEVYSRLVRLKEILTEVHSKDIFIGGVLLLYLQAL